MLGLVARTLLPGRVASSDGNVDDTVFRELG